MVLALYLVTGVVNQKDLINTDFAKSYKAKKKIKTQFYFISNRITISDSNTIQDLLMCNE